MEEHSELSLTCQNCRWSSYPGVYKSYVRGRERATFKCRRHPPIPVKDGLETVWPEVMVDDWCGEHEGRISDV